MRFSKFWIFRQSDILPDWAGGFLVQLQQSLVYVGIANVVMLIFTTWYTAGISLTKQYASFLSLWHIVLAGIILWLAVVVLDRKYFAPARQRYMNSHAVIHKNPSMDLLRKMEAQLVAQDKRLENIEKMLLIIVTGTKKG